MAIKFLGQAGKANINQNRVELLALIWLPWKSVGRDRSVLEGMRGLGEDLGLSSFETKDGTPGKLQPG